MRVPCAVDYRVLLSAVCCSAVYTHAFCELHLYIDSIEKLLDDFDYVQVPKASY